MKKPYETVVDGKYSKLFPSAEDASQYRERHPNAVRLGVFAVYMFRQAPELDYIRSYFAEEEVEIYTFDQRELAIWLGGVALADKDRRILHLANRSNSSFGERYGWNPLVLIRDEPNEQEKAIYVQYSEEQIDEEWEEFFDE